MLRIISRETTNYYNQLVFQNQLIENFASIYDSNLNVNELCNSIFDTFTQTLDKNAPMQKMTEI